MRLPSSVRPALLLLAAACALPITACGGDSEETTSQPADAGLQVLVKPPRANPGDTIKAEVVNDSEEQFTYGAGYELERQEGNDFKEVKLPNTPVPEIGYVAKPGESGPPVTVKLPGDLQPGQYRVVIQRDVPDVGDLSGEFEVIGDY
jgi:Big-like domain-containing protein